MVGFNKGEWSELYTFLHLLVNPNMEIVDKYLIDNIRLDSPSSTRYKMFEIYKKNNRYYFKLNLQVRFK